MNLKVTARSVRDRYNLLVKKDKKKWSEKEKASGINPKHTEINDALLDLIQRFDEAVSEIKNESEEKNGKNKEDLVKAQEVRKKSLETFGETRKRKAESEKKTRRSTSDTINFLAEKSEREHELRKEELKLRKQEIEHQTQQIQNAQLAQQAQLSMLQQQGSLMMEMFQKFFGQ